MKNLKNNKGFSLVELIIVIAIMAVLIGILAPQYLRYVEKSRLAADNDYIDSVRKACETIAADPSYNLSGDSYEVSVSNSGTSVTTDDTNGGLAKALPDIVTIGNTATLNSKTYSGQTVTIELDMTGNKASDGTALPKVTVSGQLGIAGGPSATPTP